MNTIQKKIKFLLEQLELTYLYEDITTCPEVLINEGFPVCIHIPPANGSFSNNKDQYRDAPECAIFFADVITADADRMQEENVVERMKTYAMKFIELYNIIGYFKPIYGKMIYQVIKPSWETAMIGVKISWIPEEQIGIFPHELDEKIKKLETEE